MKLLLGSSNFISNIVLEVLLLGGPIKYENILDPNKYGNIL